MIACIWCTVYNLAHQRSSEEGLTGAFGVDGEIENGDERIMNFRA